MAFLNEFKIMQKACCGNCPNIVSLLGCLTKEDFAVIIEYVPLGDLQSVLRNWKEMKKVRAIDPHASYKLLPNEFILILEVP